MGGLLLENSRDFLFYQAANLRDIEALRASLQTQSLVKLSRCVINPVTECKEYMYCGFYQVVDCISSEDNGGDVTYFKLLRCPNQTPLVPHKMVFEPGSEAESSFLSTWRAYHEYDLGHAQTPAEISTFTRAHPKPVGSSDGIFAFDFCVRCGIDGNGVVMYRCECCWQKNREVLVHPSCIEKDELRWICQADSHHWRCPDCRHKDMWLKEGLLYEDVANVNRQQQAPIPQCPEDHARPSAQALEVSLAQEAEQVPGPSDVSAWRRRKRAHVQYSSTASDSSSDKDHNYVPPSLRGSTGQHRSRSPRQIAPTRHLRARSGRSSPRDAASASSRQTSSSGAAERNACAAMPPTPMAASQASEELVDETPEDNQGVKHHGSETSPGSSLATAPLSDSESASSEEATACRKLAIVVSPARLQPAARLPAPLYMPGHPFSGSYAHTTAAAAAQMKWAASTPARLAPATVPRTHPAYAARQLPSVLSLSASMSHPASARRLPAAAGSVQAQPGASGASSTEAAEPLAVQNSGTLVPATTAFETEPLANAQMSSPDEPSASPVTFRKAVQAVNERLQKKSDMRLITPEKLKGLDDTLEISVLLEVSKGDSRDLLMNGGGLSLKQALYMQAEILRQSVHVLGAVLSLEAPLSAGTGSSSSTLSTVVADVNEGLKNNLIKPQQVEGLERSLNGIEDLLNLAKGDIKDVLTEELFGGKLSPMQAASMQMRILRIKAAMPMC
ncbi:hypothetical protein ABBQ32_006756 [Trebouxia sp. C0010 RCD-2024]